MIFFSKNLKQLKIAHWNCFKLTQSRHFELENFLNFFKPDIFSLQEIKLNEEEVRLNLNFHGYTAYINTRKVSPEHGGGVAVLIRSDIPHSPINVIDESLEIVGLKVELNEVCFDFFSLYSPPNQVIPYEFFIDLEVKKSEFILVGDLNSKTKTIGCKSRDQSGDILDQILNDTSFIIHNNESPTYFQFRNDIRILKEKDRNIPQYAEILDLVLSSSSLSNKIQNFEVQIDHQMTSDHCPITFSFELEKSYKLDKNENKTRLNFAKADWALFRKLLEETAKVISESTLYSLNIDQLNDLITKHLLDAVEKSIPKYINRGKNSLPKYIVDMIKQKREIRKEMKKKNSGNLKTFYNRLTSQIKVLIKEYREKLWLNMFEKFGPYPVSSRLFWQKINLARSSKQSAAIPTLIKDSVEYKSDEEKSGVFASMLSEIYSANDNEHDFDENIKHQINEEVKLLNFSDDFLPFSTFDLVKAIQKIKVGSSPGEDTLHNILLKNIPYDYLNRVLSVLVNRAVSTGIPNEWKKAKIIMIPKHDGKSKDPEKYRPISLTSCLGKLVERLIKKRLYNQLEGKKFFAKQQSGFRNKKGASDSLLFFTQKISETLNREKKACGIFFDISKAFDKVWHNGLVYKLIKLNVPSYILKYIIDFLKDRKFRVCVGDSMSKVCEILCSVPQGSVLGPLLFLIFINDIPLADSKHISYSSLFADDLATLFFYNKKGKIKVKIKAYLKSLVSWLFKWRLKMNASKCSYIIFSGAGSRNTEKFEMNFGNGNIPYNPNPIFLGVTFDEFLNFKDHTDNLVTRARKRLNIIKIFSHKSWHLSHVTLKGVYNAIISSIFNYSFFAVARIAKTNLEKLQRIQNRAIRSIYRLEWTSPSIVIHALSNLLPVRDRLIQLGERHLAKALLNNEYVFLLLQEYLGSISSIRRNERDTPICLFHKK